MNLNTLKPNKENIFRFVLLGISLLSIGFMDILSNTFLNFNITGFFPSIISYFSPLILGAFGLYYIRIENSGNITLDKINKNLNSSNINAILSLIVVFILIKYVPALLNWVFFDANFLGNTKEDCTGDGACWVFVRVWFNRFMYGMYPDAEQWRINISFLILLGSIGSIFILPQKFKKYIIIFLLFIFPVIALNLISGGIFGLIALTILLVSPLITLYYNKNEKHKEAILCSFIIITAMIFNGLTNLVFFHDLMGAFFAILILLNSIASYNEKYI